MSISLWKRSRVVLRKFPSWFKMDIEAEGLSHSRPDLAMEVLFGVAPRLGKLAPTVD